jgi:hypothetical protein
MGFEDSPEYKKIFKFSNSTGLRLFSRESNIVEFKESFNWNSKSDYAKNASGFVNNKGGYLVFGIKDKPRDLIGLQNDHFDTLDEATITQYFNSILSPEVEFEKFLITVRNKKVGVLRFYEAKHKPIISIKSDLEIKEGEIYYRYNARTEKIKFPELKNLLDQIKENERSGWMELFGKISKIGPENTALVDMVKGKIEGKTGTLVIDHELIPKLKFIQEGRFKEKGHPTLKLIGEVRSVSIVSGKDSLKSKNIRITDDPGAIAVREETILAKYPLSYAKLRDALYVRYSNFRPTKRFYALKKKLMTNQKFCHSRYLDPANPQGTKKDFYSEAIIKEFDKYYKIKKDK